MNLLWKRRGTKFIAPYWHSNKETHHPLHTAGVHGAKHLWQELEQPRAALWTAVWGWEPPLSHPSFSPSTVKWVTWGFVSSPKQPLQFYLVELGWIGITLVYSSALRRWGELWLQWTVCIKYFTSLQLVSIKSSDFLLKKIKMRSLFLLRCMCRLMAKNSSKSKSLIKV